MRGKLFRIALIVDFQGNTPAYAGKTADSVAEVCEGWWNTPAYAGKTPRTALAGQPLREHPRVCGENTVPVLGKYARLRNTPAYAGKTLHDQRVSEPKPDFSITRCDKPNTTAHALDESNWEP